MSSLDEKIKLAYRKSARKLYEENLISTSVRKFGNQYFPSTRFAEFLELITSSFGTAYVLEENFSSLIDSSLSSEDKQNIITYELSNDIVKKLESLVSFKPNGDSQEQFVHNNKVVDSIVSSFSSEYKDLIRQRLIASEDQAINYAVEHFNALKHGVSEHLPSYTLDASLFGDFVSQNVKLPGGSSNAARDSYVSSLNYDDVVGLDDKKEVLMRQLVKPMQNSAAWEKLKKYPDKIVDYRNFLLIGISGTGKTRLAEATAGELEIPFFAVNGPDFVQPLQGDGKNQLKELYAQASQYNHAIIYFDEADMILHRRTSREAELKGDVITQLLYELDGLGTTGNVATMFSTNMSFHDIDPAMLSRIPGENKLRFSPVDIETAKKILSYHIGLYHHDDFDENQLHELTKELYQGNSRNLAQIAQSAASYALWDDRDRVSFDDLYRAVHASLRGAE